MKRPLAATILLSLTVASLVFGLTQAPSSGSCQPLDQCHIELLGHNAPFLLLAVFGMMTA